MPSGNKKKSFRKLLTTHTDENSDESSIDDGNHAISPSSRLRGLQNPMLLSSQKSEKRFTATENKTGISPELKRFLNLGHNEESDRTAFTETADGNTDQDPEYDFFFDQFGPASDAREKHMEGIQDLKIIDMNIYRKHDNSKRSESLHIVVQNVNVNSPLYCLDGELVLSSGERQRLHAVDIIAVSIGYVRDFEDGEQPKTSTTTVWIQTKVIARYGSWYVAELAALVYEPCFTAFLWLAQFAKHVIDYLAWSSNHNIQIHLIDFESNFIKTLLKWHRQEANFTRWYAMCDKATDFRQMITCSNYATFIYGQAFHTKDEEDDYYDDAVFAQPLWDEIAVRSFHDARSKKATCPKTLVTAHIEKSFLQSFPEWGVQKLDLLKVAILDPEVQQWRESRRKALGLRLVDFETSRLQVYEVLYQAKNTRTKSAKPKPGKKLVGKVVLVRVHGKKCHGRPCACPDLRFAYVHSTDALYGEDLEVSWLLTPSKTACFGRHAGRESDKKAYAFYPVTNELFLNGDTAKATVSASDVLRSFTVAVNPKHVDLPDSVFISQVYSHLDKSFRVLDNASLGKSPLELLNPELEAESLHMLSLFVGSGLLDFGIDCGSDALLKTIFAVDMDEDAIKSCEANRRPSQRCQYHCDDVLTLFEEFCSGSRPLFNVDCLIAGCPCQGFSILNNHKDTEKSQKNCSLLAHTLSWIELFLPKMVVIENVPQMDPSATKGAQPTAAGQAICSLVSLGYQAKLITINSSNYGGATDRERIFIVATIPSIPLPDVPPATTGGDDYSHYTSSTVEGITRGLNDIDNDTTINVLHPNHVPCKRLNTFAKGIVSLIPREVPRKSKKMGNLSSAVPFMNSSQLEWFKAQTAEQRSRNGSSYLRANPSQPLGTITTTFNIIDARTTAKIHWEEDRTLSFEELRRCHGASKYILVGSLASQTRQLGNSVAFASSTLIGKMLAVSVRKARFRQLKSSLPRARPSAYASNGRNLKSDQVMNIWDEGLALELQSHDVVDSKNERDAIGVNVPRVSPQKHLVEDSDMEEDSDEDVIVPKRPRLNKQTATNVIVPPSRQQSNSNSCPNLDVDKTVRRQFDVSSCQPLINVPQLPLKSYKQPQDDQPSRASFSGRSIAVTGHRTARQPKSGPGSTQETAIMIDDD